MQNYAKSVATEILRQLGGNRFIVMTGAKSFSYFDENGECGVTFRLPSNFAMKGINLVKIKLDFTDTYQVKFSRVRGAEVKDTPSVRIVVTPIENTNDKMGTDRETNFTRT